MGWDGEGRDGKVRGGMGGMRRSGEVWGEMMRERVGWGCVGRDGRDEKEGMEDMKRGGEGSGEMGMYGEGWEG